MQPELLVALELQDLLVAPDLQEIWEILVPRELLVALALQDLQEGLEQPE